MELSILAATNFGHEPAEWEVKDFAARCARVCYLPGTLTKVLEASLGSNLALAETTLISGHHSVYDHSYVTLALEGIPKILAMVLNNEHVYTTSEQSGRYTKLKVTGVAESIYEFWRGALQRIIRERLPELADVKKIDKLAMENARYFIPVFAPTTTMVYTCSIRQLNYIYHWMAEFCATEVETDFERRLQKVLVEFCWELNNQEEQLIIPRLQDNKLRGLSLCTEWRRWRMLAPAVRLGYTSEQRARQLVQKEDPDYWGTHTYETSYWASLAYLAQAQRHRTLHYEMRIPEPALAQFYVPPILPDEWIEEWLNHMEQVRDEYPQGMLVRISESGHLEDLIQKGQERICGEAQLEICQQTQATMDEWYTESIWNHGRWQNAFVAEALRPFVRVDGCKRVKLSGAKCNEPCIWARKGLEMEDRFL